MAILNHEELQRDIVEMLVVHFDIDTIQALEIVDEDEVLAVANEMFSAEEKYVSELAERIINGYYDK